MEAKEGDQHVELSGKGLVSDGDEGGGIVEGSSLLFPEAVSISDSNAGVPAVSKVVDNTRFDEVSLKDCEENAIGSEGSCRLPNLDDVGRFSGGLQEILGASQGQYMTESLSSGVDLYDESGYSPIGSPPAFKQKSVMPNVPPELLHIIDAAIMGQPESMEKLKNIVSGIERFGDEGDSGSAAFLIVDSLLSTMGGVESFGDREDNNPPNVMLNSRAAIVSGELIPWLPCDGDSYIVMSPRTRMVRGLLAILRACTRNRVMCSTAGLLSVLLRSVEEIFVRSVNSKDQMRWDVAPLCCCIQYLAAHSLSVIDLHKWFQVITKTLTTIWAPRLMVAFEKAVGGEESRGPTCTFEFIGERSGLLGPGDSHWPFSNGYAFVTWLYVESFADTLNTATAAAAIGEAAASTSGITSPKTAAAAASTLAGESTMHMPRLFSFLSGDNEGMEAYFHSQFLVVESGNGKEKKSSLRFSHAFKPKRWYFIGIEHTCKQVALGKDENELRLYIDGSLHERRPFEFTQISKPLAFCCIGTNPPPNMVGSEHCPSQCPLFGEMGTVYIFNEPIGPEKMTCLARRGSDVLPSFGSGAGIPWLATADHIRSMSEESSILDAEITGCIHLLYHPKLHSGRFCPDASSSSAAGLLQRPAEVLGQVHVAMRVRPVEALWALTYGGPMSLLPLGVGNMKIDSLEPEQGNRSLSLATSAMAAPILRTIAMAIRHPGNSEEVSRGRGPEILSKILNYLFQTLSSRSTRNPDGVEDEELVAAVVSLCQAPDHNHALKVQLFSTLLLDLEIWSLCNYRLQKKLLSSLASMVIKESSVLRAANAIQMLLDGCRRCYWLVREKDSVRTFSLQGGNHSVGEVNALIEYVFIVIELLVVQASPSSVVDDMHCLLGFVVDCPQPNQVSRALHLLYRLVVQPNADRSTTFVEAFLSCGGIESLLVLLQREVITGDHGVSVGSDDEEFTVDGCESGVHSVDAAKVKYVQVDSNVSAASSGMLTGRMMSASENYFVQNGGGISFKTNSDNDRSNIYNANKSGGIALGIIKLLRSLDVAGHLKLGIKASSDVTSDLLVAEMHDPDSSMFEDKVCLLFFALQKKLSRQHQQGF